MERVRACEIGELQWREDKKGRAGESFVNICLFSRALCPTRVSHCLFTSLSHLSRDILTFIFTSSHSSSNSSSHLHIVTLEALCALWKGKGGIRSATKSRKIPTLWVRRRRRILQRRRTRKWRRTWRHAGVGGSQCPCGTLATDHRLTQTPLLHLQ